MDPCRNSIMDIQETLIGFYVALSNSECCPLAYDVLEFI